MSAIRTTPPMTPPAMGPAAEADDLCDDLEPAVGPLPPTLVHTEDWHWSHVAGTKEQVKPESQGGQVGVAFVHCTHRRKRVRVVDRTSGAYVSQRFDTVCMR